MPTLLHMIPVRSFLPPRTWAVCSPWVLLLSVSLGLGALLPVGAIAAAASGDPVHGFKIPGGHTVQVNAAAGLTLRDATNQEPLLTTEVIVPGDTRRRRGADNFHAVVSEATPGGRRGFSPLADDDQDGQIDEDPLDGRDNDQDGKTDEDFAAISEAMIAFHLGEPGAPDRGLQIEYYHWDTARLSPAVFLQVGGGSGNYRIHSRDAGWQAVQIQSLTHSLSGRAEPENATALVCRVNRDGAAAADPCAPGAGLWLGVMILAEDSPARFRVDRNRLDLPVDGRSVPLVMCTADSWAQLNRILGDALKVYAGVTDPVDSRRAHWIVPASCPTCRNALPPDFRLVSGTDDETILVAEVSPGRYGLLDPDHFQVAGHWLGVPRQIRWLPAGGPKSTTSWICMTADRLQNGAASLDIFTALQAHDAQGRLELIFESLPDLPAAAGSGTTGLAGRYLDGRNFEATLVFEPTQSLETAPASAAVATAQDTAPETLEEATQRFARDRTRNLKSGRGGPSLSADLLVGWPNPFNDAINLRFVVPRTVRQAFVWKNDQDKPADMDLDAEVPWSGGQPNVSVKIYSINGQELVTLHSAAVGEGEYTVRWNGTDAFGRKVASGTYFCKLQLDDWSVTRRLVFLR